MSKPLSYAHEVAAERPLVLALLDGGRLSALWEAFDAAGLNLEAAAADLSGPIPDALLIDARRLDEPLIAALAHPARADLPMLLLAGDSDADRAGAMLGRPALEFASPVMPAPELARLLRQLTATGSAQRVADAGTAFVEARIEALRRDAERVAAALAELAAGRETADSHRPVTAERIRAHLKARRLRERFFAADLFADPAWDMLCDLSAAELEGRRVSVSSLCIAAAVPTTTALRWIRNLMERGMLDREPDPSDGRRAFIRLSPPTAEAMKACLDACLNLPGQ